LSKTSKNKTNMAIDTKKENEILKEEIVFSNPELNEIDKELKESEAKLYLKAFSEFLIKRKI